MKKVSFKEMINVIFNCLNNEEKIPKFYIMNKGEELNQIKLVNLKDSTLIDSNGYTISATLSNQLEIYQYIGD